MAWLQHQKKKWRAAAAARAKQKKQAEKARKRGRGNIEEDAGQAGGLSGLQAFALDGFH